MAWAVDRGTTSDDNLRELKRGGAHYIARGRMRAGKPTVEEALSRPRRYQRVGEDLEVDEVVVGEGEARCRHAVVRNLAQMVRDREARELQVKRIEDAIARLPWPAMVERFDRRVERYAGLVYFDATGVGNVVRDLLSVPAVGLVLAGKTRSDMLTQYMVGVEGGQIEAPRIEYAYGEHRFASVDDLFGSGHLPDSVCAMALAWMGAAPKAVMTGRLSA
jgi:hypothetical protein